MSDNPATFTKGKAQYLNSLVTPVGRVSYPYLVSIDDKGQYATNGYKLDLLMEPDSINDLREKLEKFAASCFPGVPINEVHFPFKDGNAKSNENYHGKVLITIKSKRPQTAIGIDNKPLDLSQVYSGCWACVKVAAGTYTKEVEVRDAQTRKITKEKEFGISLFFDSGKPGEMKPSIKKMKDDTRWGGAESAGDEFPGEEADARQTAAFNAAAKNVSEVKPLDDDV